MSGQWRNSDRRSRLPADWPAQREACRVRAGGRCERIKASTGKRCPNQGRDADHVDREDPSSPLEWLCPWHHRKKTAREGVAARTPRTLPPRRERHPGDLT